MKQSRSYSSNGLGSAKKFEMFNFKPIYNPTSGKHFGECQMLLP